MAHAELGGDGSIWITTSWNEKPLVQQIPGARWNQGDRVWKCNRSWAAYVQLLGIFCNGITFGPALTEWGSTYERSVVQPALRLRELTEWPADDVLPDSLYPFQRAGAAFMTFARDVLLADEMGCGKTVQIEALLEALFTTGESALPALIVTPNSVKEHWSARAPRWCPSAVPIVLPGGTVRARRTLADARHEPNALVIANYDAVRALSRSAPYGSVRLNRCRVCDPRHGDDITAARCETHPKELNQFGFVSVIVDEAHRMAKPKSRQTRALWAIMHGETVVRRLGATGTPITRDVSDLWSIMHGIAPYDFPVKGPFIDRYALMGWNSFGGTDIVGLRPDTVDEFYRIVHPHMRRMLIDVVLPQLPPKVREVRRIDMSPSQSRQYRELDHQLHTRGDDGELLLVVPNQLVKSTRLLQFAAGHVAVEKPDPDDVSSWRVRITEPSPKLDDLDEILDELGVTDRDPTRRPQVVIRAEHLDLLYLAAARLERRRVSHAFIVGDVTVTERRRVNDEFQAGHVTALLITSGAGGEGLDLFAANTLINLQRSWDIVREVQTEARVRRIGSERHPFVRIVDIIVRGTIEETRQTERLLEKLQRLDEITLDRAARRRAGLDVSELDSEESEIMRTNLLMEEE